MTTRGEVIAAVRAMVQKKWKGDFRAAFDAEDKNGDGQIDRSEVINILVEARVGYQITRGTIAGMILQELDGNGDGLISWDEFNTALKVTAH